MIAHRQRKGATPAPAGAGQEAVLSDPWQRPATDAGSARGASNPPRAERRIWVEISRGALLHNFAEAQRRLPAGTDICAVVKADAYGHGAAACARLFTQAGARWLAVTSVDEGIRLRQAGLTGRLLVLAGFTAAESAALVEHALTPAIWAPEQAAWLQQALRRRHRHRFPVHVKLDSGMGRLGATAGAEAALAVALRQAPRLAVEAVFSHFSAAEADDAAISRRQRADFLAARRRLAAALDLEAESWPWHLLNSTGALRFPQWGGTLARVGLTLYGYALREPASFLRPALSWRTRVVAVKDLPAGHGVGYGSRFRTPRPMRVAALAAGYADGYRRDLWPGAVVLMRGQLAPVIGNISMDLTTVNASGIAVELGDVATLLGEENDTAISAQDLAAQCGTIPYEILCGISARVERIYVD